MKGEEMGTDKEWFEIIMKQANGSLMTALENHIQADIGVTRGQAKRVANHILDVLDIVNENREQKIRNKAIDEFVERIEQYCSMSEMNRKMIQQIAEEMKAGGENEID